MAYPLLESNVGNKIIVNHQILDISQPGALMPDYPDGETKYYEVIRCIDGIPLFLEDHMDRLKSSVQELIPWDRNQLQNEVGQLIKSNGIMNGNIRIVLTKTIQLLYANQYYYPSQEEYSAGVRVGLLQWKRTDPNVKVVREDYKNAISKKLGQPGAYGAYFETLLVDDDGYITEGSRSNVFFVKGNQVFTAPDEDILKGITRKYVLEAVRKAGATLVPNKIPVPHIGNFWDINAAFLSGTSIGVLPICAIEETRFPSSTEDMVLRIRKEYDKIIKDYLDIHSA